MKLDAEELEIFELAFNLRITVNELLNTMPYEEFLGWIDYFKQRPIGWREDNRTFMTMRSFGVKIKPEDAFQSLALMHQNEMRASDSERQVKTLSKSFIFQKMLTAQGGEKLDFMKGE